jgi:peptide/nickel transport system substrate-binding protein
MENPAMRTAQNLDRRQFLRSAAALGAAAGLPGLLAACGGSDPAGTSPGAPTSGGASQGTVTGGLSYNIAELDPAIGADISTFTSNWHVYEGLVDFDPVTHELNPALAAAEPEQVSETIYRAKLRDGATFHDGAPVRASDVVFSFERVKDPKTASLYAPFIEFIDQVRAVDERTVEFELAYPTTLVNSRLAVVKIVPEKHARKPKALSLHPIGTGPYAFVEVQANDHMTWKRYGKYNGPKKAGAGEITIRTMQEASARLAALRAGEIETMEDPAYRDLASLGSTDGLTSKAIPGFNQTIIMFNCAKPPFDDKRVRQAMMYAIDREALLKEVYLDNAEIATSFLPRDWEGYAQPSVTYTYDPEKARSLLADAGHADGLDFELQVNAVSWIAPQGAFVKDQLAQGGLRATLRVGQSAALFDRVTRGAYQAFLTSTDPSTLASDADVQLRWIFSGNIAENFLYWKTPEAARVTKLLNDATRLADTGKRDELWAEVQQIVWEEAPCPSLHQRFQPTAWQQSLSGYQPLGTGGLYLLPKA